MGREGGHSGGDAKRLRKLGATDSSPRDGIGLREVRFPGYTPSNVTASLRVIASWLHRIPRLEIRGDVNGPVIDPGGTGGHGRDDTNGTSGVDNASLEDTWLRVSFRTQDF